MENENTLLLLKDIAETLLIEFSESKDDLEQLKNDLKKALILTTAHQKLL